MDTLYQNIDLPKIAERLAIESKGSTYIALQECLQRWPKTTADVNARTRTMLALKEELDRSPLPVDFAEFHTLEASLTPLLHPPSDVESEGYSQVCFRDSPWTALNTIPFALIILSFYKTYLLPTMTVLLPVMMMILPYFMLASMNVGISFEEYRHIMWGVFSKAFIPQTNTFDQQLRALIQFGSACFSIGQGIYHPVQQAIHFRKLDISTAAMGDSILALHQFTETLYNSPYKQWLAPWTDRWISAFSARDPREAFAFVLDHPYWLNATIRNLAQLEVRIRVVSAPVVCPVEWKTSTTPCLVLEGFADPCIEAGIARRSLFTSAGHTILTGPNRGGKSSSMRGLLTNVLFAHAFGMCFAKRAISTRFSWIANGLALDDLPGSMSMFEREVAFAASVFRPRKGFGFVVYDECFHSTNPSDSLRTAITFCSRLWKDTRCISVVSTHLYSLAQQAPPTIQKLCVPAKREGGVFTFEYVLKEGICTLSSVDSLLEQYGLLRPAYT